MSLSDRRRHRRSAYLIPRLATAIALVAASGALATAGASSAAAAPGDFTSYSANYQDIAFVTLGPGGNPWFIGQHGGEIGYVDVATGVTTTYPVVARGEHLIDLTEGPDGNMWFVDRDAGALDEFNRATHAVTVNTLPNDIAGPWSVVSDAGKLWFTEHNTAEIGSFDPSTSTFASYGPIAGATGPIGLAVAPDGVLWFTASLPSGQGTIGSINPDAIDPGSTLRAITSGIPTNSGAESLTVMPDGTVWLPEVLDHRLDSYVPSTATWTTGADLGAVGRPEFVVAGPNSSVWYSTSSSGSASPDALGYLNPTTGDPINFSVTASDQEFSQPVLASDGNIWVGAENGEQMWRLELSHPVCTTNNPVVDAAVGTAFTTDAHATDTVTVSYSLTSGALPAGLTLDGATGIVSGTPTATGYYTFTVTAADADNSCPEAMAINVSAVAKDPTGPASGNNPGHDSTLASTGVEVVGPLMVGMLLIATGMVLFLRGRAHAAR